MKTRFGVVVAVALLALTGCGGTALDPAPEIRGVVVTLEDGREVDCVTRASGGIDCDWENTRTPEESP